MHVPPVDISPLAAVDQPVPGLRMVLLNCTGLIKRDELQRLLNAGNVSMDTSMVEGVGGIGRLLEQLPAKKVVFGSYYPFFYLESALLKMQESALTEAQKTALFKGNARNLMAGAMSARGARQVPYEPDGPSLGIFVGDE